MPFRVVSDQQADATLWFVASEPVIAAFSELPGATVRASFDVRSPDEVRRADRLEAELLQMLCAAGRRGSPAVALRPVGPHRAEAPAGPAARHSPAAGAVQRPAAAWCGDRAACWRQRLRRRAATTTLRAELQSRQRGADARRLRVARVVDPFAGGPLGRRHGNEVRRIAAAVRPSTRSRTSPHPTGTRARRRAFVREPCRR